MAAAAPSVATVAVSCPECGSPIHVTVHVEHATPVAQGGKVIDLAVTAPDAADEIRNHIERGDCGRHPVASDG